MSNELKTIGVPIDLHKELQAEAARLSKAMGLKIPIHAVIRRALRLYQLNQEKEKELPSVSAST